MNSKTLARIRELLDIQSTYTIHCRGTNKNFDRCKHQISEDKSSLGEEALALLPEKLGNHHLESLRGIASLLLCWNPQDQAAGLAQQWHSKLVRQPSSEDRKTRAPSP